MPGRSCAMRYTRTLEPKNECRNDVGVNILISIYILFRCVDNSEKGGIFSGSHSILAFWLHQVEFLTQRERA